MPKYDIALLEKPGEEGLTREEIEMLLDKLDTKSNPLSVYPIEIENSTGESSAMGFITAESADRLYFMYNESSEIGCKIKSILADTNNERPDKTYQLKDVTIFLDR